VPEQLRADWKAASADVWRLQAEAGGIASEGATSDPGPATDAARPPGNTRS